MFDILYVAIIGILGVIATVLGFIKQSHVKTYIYTINDVDVKVYYKRDSDGHSHRQVDYYYKGSVFDGGQNNIAMIKDGREFPIGASVYVYRKGDYWYIKDSKFGAIMYGMAVYITGALIYAVIFMLINM